jgi:hypothetical protein
MKWTLIAVMLGSPPSTVATLDTEKACYELSFSMFQDDEKRSMQFLDRQAKRHLETGDSRYTQDAPETPTYRCVQVSQ